MSKVNSNSPLLFPELAREQGKPIVAAFDGGDLTTDGGLLLLAQADQRLGLSTAIARSMSERRQVSKVLHPLTELVSSRIGALAMGYSDCNDLTRLGRDPAHLLFSGLSPESGALASQATFSRFENRVKSTDLLKVAKEIARRIIDQLPADTKQIIIDGDATVDPCHGQQELEGFNDYYGNHCYLPLLIHLVEKNGRRWQVASVLRSGKSGGAKGFQTVVKRVIAMLRERFPEIKIIIRCDGGFGGDSILTFCESQKVSYVIGLPQNPALHRAFKHEEMDACLRYSMEKQHWQLQTKRAARKRLAAQARRKAGKGDAGNVELAQAGESDPVEEYECAVYRRLAYQAGSWMEPRSVVVKAAITNGELNSRFVVTNLTPHEYSPRGRNFNSSEVYWFYCQRGDQENRIKEWKIDMDGGRTSCHRFAANQFRLLLHQAAMLLLNVLQSKMPTTRRFANLQINTLRLHILKVAARVTVSCRRICVHLASSFPHQDIWLQLNRALACVT